MVANSIIIFGYSDLPDANALPRALQLGAELQAKFPEGVVIQGTFGNTSQFLERLAEISREAYSKHFRHQVWMVGMCGELSRLELGSQIEVVGDAPEGVELFAIQLDPTPEQPHRLGFVTGTEILDAVRPPVGRTLVLVLDPSDEGPRLDLDHQICGTTQTHRQTPKRRPGDPIQFNTSGDIIYLTLTRVENSGWCAKYHERVVARAKSRGVERSCFPNTSTGLVIDALFQTKGRTWQEIVHILSTTILRTTSVPVVVLYETNNHRTLSIKMTHS